MCDMCWCCGMFTALDRAHIQALVDGGEDVIEKIHLLCRNCHKATEHLSGTAYWDYLENYPWEPVRHLILKGIALAMDE